jgi:hypothetical protein
VWRVVQQEQPHKHSKKRKKTKWGKKKVKCPGVKSRERAEAKLRQNKRRKIHAPTRRSLPGLAQEVTKRAGASVQPTCLEEMRRLAAQLSRERANHVFVECSCLLSSFFVTLLLLYGEKI